MIYFTYNDIESNDYDIVAKSIDRALLPRLRKREISIPGKHGTYDFGSNRYDNRIITVEIKFIGSTFNNLRLNARDIAEWLSSESYKELVFSDEPLKYYLAKIYNESALQNLLRLGSATLMFECQPHALSTITSLDDVYLDSDVLLDSDIALGGTTAYTISL
jgi:predicted phage tail component-like protein